MILKEAFRYQNYFSSLLEGAATCFRAPNFATKTTERHMKHKANANAQDETVEVVSETSPDFTPDDVINFMVFIERHKEELTNKISEAKKNCADVDIDAEIANNTHRRFVGEIFKSLASTRPKTSKSRASGYTFNNEGNQVSYYYDMETTTEPKYDVVKAAKLSKEFATEADSFSNAVDKAMVEVDVPFETIFNPNDNFAEAIAVYLANYSEFPEGSGS